MCDDGSISAPQLKEDFVHGSLYPPVSVNNAIWMVAADMAKEAAEKNKTFSEFRSAPQPLPQTPSPPAPQLPPYERL